MNISPQNERSSQIDTRRLKGLITVQGNKKSAKKSIVRMATQVSQKLIEAKTPLRSSNFEEDTFNLETADQEKFDVDTILSVPNYIYFE